MLCTSPPNTNPNTDSVFPVAHYYGYCSDTGNNLHEIIITSIFSHFYCAKHPILCKTANKKKTEGKSHFNSNLDIALQKFYSTEMDNINRGFRLRWNFKVLTIAIFTSKITLETVLTKSMVKMIMFVTGKWMRAGNMILSCSLKSQILIKVKAMKLLRINF